ncbi:MAG TPA: PAS domain S-box protein [Terriglobales bacterium]|nr:PAS domain S-box protein [Terriglobales bacterium]
MSVSPRTPDVLLRETFFTPHTSVISFLNKIHAGEREKKELVEWGENLEITGRNTKITAWRWSFNTGLLEYAPRFREVFGFAPFEPVTYDTWVGHMHPDSRERAKSSLADFLAGSTREYHNEQAYVTAGGEIHWVETRGLVERTHLGKPKRLTAICFDVTKAKNLELALRESEQHFRALFEQTAVGMARLDLKGSYIQVNDRFCDITKYSREELLRMGVSEIRTGETTKDLDLRNRLLSGEIPRFTTEERYARKDGSIAWVLRTLSLARNGLLAPQYFIAVIDDITDRKQMEQELKDGRQRLEAAIAASGTATFRWDLLTDEWSWDENMARLFGLAPGQALKSFDDVLSAVVAEDRNELIECCNQCAKEGNNCESEFRVNWPDGSVHHLYARGEAFCDENRGLTHITGAFLDLTARRQMEVQIETSARLSALGTMAGGVAHEINNPLSIVHAAAADLLRRAKSRTALSREIVLRNSERIVQMADRIAKIVKSMRNLAREGSQDKVRATRVAKIVEEVLEVCKERFKNHSVKLFVASLDPTITVYCREVQIAQVLLNVLQNAFEAVREQTGEKWVRVAVVVQGSAVEFSVTDNGPEIPSHLQSKIMEPFFTTKDVGKGMGLGLSLSRKIVEDHGGKLELLNDEGHTCFAFRLPLSLHKELYAA